MVGQSDECQSAGGLGGGGGSTEVRGPHGRMVTCAGAAGGTCAKRWPLASAVSQLSAVICLWRWRGPTCGANARCAHKPCMRELAAGRGVQPHPPTTPHPTTIEVSSAGAAVLRDHVGTKAHEHSTACHAATTPRTRMLPRCLHLRPALLHIGRASPPCTPLMAATHARSVLEASCPCSRPARCPLRQ